MRKLFQLFALLFTASIIFTSCDEEQEQAPTVVPVQSVTLNVSEFSIAMGAPAVNLTATIAPTNATNRTVAWSSSNEQVATVNANGAVTAVSIGTATITIITADGARTATATVIVTPAPILVTGVTLNRNTLELAIDASETLIATITPANATNRDVTWSSSNTAVATVNANGLVTAVAGGTTTITVTTADGGRTATCVVKVTATPPGIGNPTATTDPGVVIGGVRWATRNVDAPGTFAPHPHSIGMLYQWNRRIGWSYTNPRVNSQGGTTWDGSIPSGTIWERENDPCPVGWRVPTMDELRLLAGAPARMTVASVEVFAIAGQEEEIFIRASRRMRMGNGNLYSGLPSGGRYAQFWGAELFEGRFCNANACWYELVGTSFTLRPWHGGPLRSVSGLWRNWAIPVRCVAE